MDNIKLGKHAWLVVTNTSSSNITVGALTVAPGKSVTIGTYGTNDGHPGIWYNKEGYHRANYTDNRSYVMDLTDVNLSALSAVVMIPYDGKVYYGGASPTVWSGK